MPPPTGRPAAAQKLLLVLTDGKPNDVDHYEGRFAVEDTRKAVREARRLGVAVFGVTVDAGAQSYFPTLFGRGGYAIVRTFAVCRRRFPQSIANWSADTRRQDWCDRFLTGGRLCVTVARRV